MKNLFRYSCLLSLLAFPLVAGAAVGSPYEASNLGYDVTFSARSYPAESFGFAIVGVNGGKAFVDNKQLVSGVRWAHFASRTAPTIYMNLNAPYGSTVKGHVDSPNVCAPSVGTSTEPTACQGYNYGYQAAMHSYQYALGNGFEASLWWLDIEEANSWSADVAVNDATIQGAIDYLATKDIQVGIYSTPRMWSDIAGKNFAPTPHQNSKGQTAIIPTWFPVGVKSLVGAINTCVTTKSFIPNSPLWIVQFEANSKAVDQNVAC